jgi:hypothetical protein
VQDAASSKMVVAVAPPAVGPEDVVEGEVDDDVVAESDEEMLHAAMTAPRLMVPSVVRAARRSIEGGRTRPACLTNLGIV